MGGFNGLGTYLRYYNWTADSQNPLTDFIRADKMDTEMNGFATGLSNCMTRDGEAPPLANLPMGGFKLTGLGVGSAATDSVTYGQVFNSPAFNSPTVVASPPNGDNSLLIPSTSWVVQLAFQAALPGQTGSAGGVLITNGSDASWAPMPGAVMSSFNSFGGL